jgi:hypothetical protein
MAKNVSDPRIFGTVPGKIMAVPRREGGFQSSWFGGLRVNAAAQKRINLFASC